MKIQDRIAKFNELLNQYQSGLVALSGGVDSSVLLALAVQCQGFKVAAVTAKSPAHPFREIEAAKNLCIQLNTPHHILELNELNLDQVRNNGPDRCYHCKHFLYQRLNKLSESLGLNCVLDGSNADDAVAPDRPGSRAIAELGIKTPLSACGFTKLQVRELARKLQLPMWNFPATACLYTRIPQGEEITPDRVSRVRMAEEVLYLSGFRNFRVRDHGKLARIELSENEIYTVLQKDRRKQIVDSLKKCGYDFITVDLGGYQRGSMGLSPK